MMRSHLRSLVLAPLLLLLTTAPAAAEFKAIDLTIYGMDWAVCAHAVSVRLGRLEGVESVNISLNDGRAALTLAADNTVRLAQVYTVVREAGFTPREARVTARATVRSVKERPLIEIAGTRESFAASPSERVQTADLTKRAGKVVMVEGIIEAPNGTAEPRIAVTSIDEE